MDDRSTQPLDLSQEDRSHEYIKATRRNYGGRRTCQRRRAGWHLQRGRGVRLHERRPIDVTIHDADDDHAHDSQPHDASTRVENRDAAERRPDGQALPGHGLRFRLQRKLGFQRKL
jgi:hypothetical protein